MMVVQRSEILDYQTYSDRRDGIRDAAMEAKRVRRIHVGEYLTFLFENDETIRYQVQEMMRAEQIVREEAIQHELSTYNDLLGGPGQLGCSLLIEIEKAEDRGPLLSRWLDLPKHLYVRLANDERAYASFDPRQVGDDRLSAVQYLKFDTQGQTPVAVGSDHPEISAETELNDEQRVALQADLANSG